MSKAVSNPSLTSHTYNVMLFRCFGIITMQSRQALPEDEQKTREKLAQLEKFRILPRLYDAIEKIANNQSPDDNVRDLISESAKMLDDIRKYGFTQDSDFAESMAAYIDINPNALSKKEQIALKDENAANAAKGHYSYENQSAIVDALKAKLGELSKALGKGAQK